MSSERVQILLQGLETFAAQAPDGEIWTWKIARLREEVTRALQSYRYVIRAVLRPGGGVVCLKKCFLLRDFSEQLGNF